MLRFGSRLAKDANLKASIRHQTLGTLLARYYGTRTFNLDTFPRRHNAQNESEDVKEMLKTIQMDSFDQMVRTIIPKNIFNEEGLDDTKIPRKGASETEALRELKGMMSQNRTDIKSLLGQGFYGTYTPHVILRNLFENPSWYTPYTPYQAEISQGRLESLLNFQTMVKDLTGMEVSNASLLDEATAAAEAMTMAFNLTPKKLKRFICDSAVDPTTKSLLRTRATPLDVELEFVDDLNDVDFENEKDIAGVLIQYPDTTGNVRDHAALVERVHNGGSKKTKVVAVTDLLACTQLTPPGDFGCDIVVGTNQRFGVPMGYGGPNAGFLATKKEYQRKMPGRIIGITKDRNGKLAYRMALQTREQHIRRDRATSNICTAQALLANVSAMYAVFHGPEGLKTIANAVHRKATAFADAVGKLDGFTVKNFLFFDTVAVVCQDADAMVKAALDANFNIRKLSDTEVSVAFDETTSENELERLYGAFAKVAGASESVEFNFEIDLIADSALARKSEFLTHPVFNSYHTEHELLRYMYRLEKKDVGLNTSMIPLGSCTMKLNSVAEMIPVTWPEIGSIHPYVPKDQVQGYQDMFKLLKQWLLEITGFDDMTFQPNAGSQGEYAGLYVIKKYHESRGEDHRDVCLIPISAHGTNPASAAMVSYKVVPVNCHPETGDIDLEHLQAQAVKYADRLAAVMVTYPSTYGIYEGGVKDICDIVHQYGGQVYLDGANMNAQVGFTDPGTIGADVCHLNLHKTFCIPHGGGGPGMGPIGVKSHLAPFLPNHDVVPKIGGDESIGQISMAPYGSSSILPITWMYIRMMGIEGLETATSMALLNANYMLTRLQSHYDIYYRGETGFCAHEFIIKCSPFRKASGLESGDIAKRLQDFGLHAPTQSFPIANTLMVEPTESESKEELDRYINALVKIREEIRAVEDGRAERGNNVVSNAPHAAYQLTANDWPFEYSREEAGYPLPYVRERKYYPPIARVNDEYGDRNLFCECPPMEMYTESL